MEEYRSSRHSHGPILTAQVVLVKYSSERRPGRTGMLGNSFSGCLKRGQTPWSSRRFLQCSRDPRLPAQGV
jgi:hypothetical protein